MESKVIKSRELHLKGREWPCMQFCRIDISKPDEVAEFICWLCGLKDPSSWMQDREDSNDPERLLEALWSWQGAPRKRMAKLCWQLLVKNQSREYFDQQFSFSEDWLARQASDSARLLGPIQKKLLWVLKGFQERRQKDNAIGQGSWGEEWLLPPPQTSYVRKNLRRTQPDLVEESSNYEDSLHYYLSPYLELVCHDSRRVYVGEHQAVGGARVWIEDRNGVKYPLSRTTLPFAQAPGTGFSWGYHGSGPSELSLSILADSVGGDLDLAKQLQTPFIAEVLVHISWDGNLTLSHKKVLTWLKEQNIGPNELARAKSRVRELEAAHATDLAEHKERLRQIQQIGGLRMQRFDIVPRDFEAALYVDLMRMFERASWVLHCSRCGQPVACERTPRGNRQRARWTAGKPIYHETCFIEHRRSQKRTYWAERSKEQSFRVAERRRARERRRRL